MGYPVSSSAERAILAEAEVFMCPTAQNAGYQRDVLSYGYNYGQLGNWVGPGSNTNIRAYSDINHHSQKLVLVDSNEDGSSDHLAHRAWALGLPGQRHAGGCNVLFADWHVEYFSSARYYNELLVWPGPFEID